MSEKDLAAELTSQSLVAKIDRDLLIATTLQTIQQHNAEMNALRTLFAGDTFDYTKYFRGALNNDLQEGDEYARPEPVKGHAFYSTGFPLRIAQTGWGATYTTRHQMTLEDFSEKTDQMLVGDLNWNRKWLIGTLLYDGNNGSGAAGTAGLTFTDPKYGAITVRGLANGDATTYEKTSSGTLATDSHYTAQNGAISDVAGQNPFASIETDLLEHPSNTGDVVSFVAPNLTADIQALADFVPADRFNLRSPGDQTPTFPGQLPLTLPPSARLLGVVGQTYLVEWRSVPSGLIISRTTGQGAPPLLYRQYPQAALQGFGPVDVADGNFGERFPYFNEVWYRAGGYGGWSRVAAHVHQVASSTTYAMPTGYYQLFGRTS